MIRQDNNRIDAKRRNIINPKKRQFAEPIYKQQNYPHSLNIYQIPPTAEITLEEFETWAIDRLRILAELEACSFRNKTLAETSAHIKPLLAKYLPLSSNAASSSSSPPQGALDDPLLRAQRQKDHYSHFILRLAFAATDELRRRFARVETVLFKIRFKDGDVADRQGFVQGLDVAWEGVDEAERKALREDLLAATPGLKAAEVDGGGWCKVDWEKVPELVEQRKVLVRRGMAYVPGREQMSMIVGEFADRLAVALEQTSRALPRLDEDDRLTPILRHLSQNFATPDHTSSSSHSPLLDANATLSHTAIDGLVAAGHFPLCMAHLHRSLRGASHLKHYGRLQYTLFLKGIGLALDECLAFWRRAFKLVTDDTFAKEYRYNVRHAYGDVGGDGNRRGRGYAPFSCQKILTERPPGSGESHGCPYRHFGPDNLVALLRATGTSEADVLKGVREDVAKQRYHIACNRVFEARHREELKAVKEKEGGGQGEWGETIVHPNTYFRRSYLLKHGGGGCGGGEAGKGEKMEVE